MGRLHRAMDDADDVADRIRDQVAEGKQPRDFDVYKQLALIVQQHREFHPEEDTVPIPLELLTAIATKLLGKRRWAKQERENRALAAASEKARILAEADALRARRPSITPSRAAALLLESNSPPRKVVGGKSEKLSQTVVRKAIAAHWKTR